MKNTHSKRFITFESYTDIQTKFKSFTKSILLLAIVVFEQLLMSTFLVFKKRAAASEYISCPVFGQLPPEENCPPDNCLETITPKGNCRLGKLPPQKTQRSPRTIASKENCSLENCPLTLKFPLKIIAPT